MWAVSIFSSSLDSLVQQHEKSAQAITFCKIEKKTTQCARKIMEWIILAKCSAGDSTEGSKVRGKCAFAAFFISLHLYIYPISWDTVFFCTWYSRCRKRKPNKCVLVDNWSKVVDRNKWYRGAISSRSYVHTSLLMWTFFQRKASSWGQDLLIKVDNEILQEVIHDSYLNYHISTAL